MNWNLRTKFSISHILPILVVMPVLSLYLLYTLEDFLTVNLLQQLKYQANLTRNQAALQPQILDDPRAAQAFLSQIGQLTDARVILLSQDATILGSTRQEDVERVGQRHTDASVETALRGETAQGVGPGFVAEVAYVVLPLAHNGVTRGALRVSYEVNDIRAQFSQLQWLILGGAAISAVIGLVLGVGLAATIVRPLRQLSASAESIAAGNFRARVEANTRDEVGTLAHSFNRMAERLADAGQARDRQLASIVHELARPLTVMRAAIETLRETRDQSRDMRDTLLASLQEEFTRLERMLETLQGLHKRVLRPMQLQRAPVALERVIRSCAVNYETLARQAGIALSVEVAKNLPPLRADEDRLIQVLTNLLDNAFKFTPRDGQIRVRAERDAKGVSVRVTDTGSGIAPDELPHIFEQFYSGAKSSPPEKRGMGLGLSICREIVQAHGGEIQVESTMEQGTRFTFNLPIT